MGDGRLRIAIMASGSGSNLEAILHACHVGDLQATPVAVLSNNPDALALERARRFDVPTLVADHRPFNRDRDAHELRILELLEPHAPQALVLAGYMRVVTPRLIDAFHGRLSPALPGVLNIHPADTRQYQGAHGYEFACGLLASHPQRLEETKITVHFVDTGVDTGPIIAQRVVPVLPEDSLDDLKKRGLSIEHELYPECIGLYAQGRLSIVEGRVQID